MVAADLKKFLQATPFFGGLLDASLDRVIDLLVERHFAEGATVVRENEEGRSMYVVQSGELLVHKESGSGRMVPISHLGPGDFFGDMTLIEIQPRSASVVAQTPAALFELSAASLYDLYEADVHAYAMVLQNMNREVCRRLRRANHRITELADVAFSSVAQSQRGSL
jgi:CRP/FNR family transcriptional regulator, cyclic AMP receptor protein